MIQALAAVILAPYWGSIREAVVGVRGDWENCGCWEGEDEGCADEQRDIVEEVHFDEGKEMEIAGREDRLV